MGIHYLDLNAISLAFLANLYNYLEIVFLLQRLLLCTDASLLVDCFQLNLMCIYLDDLQQFNANYLYLFLRCSDFGRNS